MIRRLFVCLAAFAIAAAGCSSESPSAYVPDVSLPLAGGGTCSVEISGDTNVSWTQKQTSGTLLVSHWLSAADRELIGVKAGDSRLIVNCEGSGKSISIMSADGTNQQQFPQGPGDYEIAVGGNGRGALPGQMNLLVNLRDGSFWSVAEPGVLHVATFNQAEFSGTFEARLNMTGDGGTVTGSASLTGMFDLGCTGSNCR